MNIPVLAKLPIKSKNAELVDKGAVELAECDEINAAAEKLTEILK